MTGTDAELEQRLRAELAELAALPTTEHRERRPAPRRSPAATMALTLVVVLGLVAASFGVVRSTSHQPRSAPGSTPTTPTTPAVTTKPTTPAPVTTATSPPTISGSSGSLQLFVPTSATTWWAVVGDSVRPVSSVVRTTDSGRQWRTVTPPVGLIASSFFLNAEAGWVEADSSLTTPRTREPVYRTLDGGRSWQRIATVPQNCQLHFVDAIHGWCTYVGGALGSAIVDLSRTTDGGATWAVVSHTGIDAGSSTPGSLPFGCEKTISFTSPTVGWASGLCAGTSAYLYRSTDGGSRWHLLPQVPLPKGSPSPEGVELGTPVVQGSDIAIAITIGGRPGATAIATSADGGTTWRSQLVPTPPRYWVVGLLSPTRWDVTDGKMLMRSTNAGTSWVSSLPTVPLADFSRDGLGALRFLSPQLGFAIPGTNGGTLWWTVDGGLFWRPISISR